MGVPTSDISLVLTESVTGTPASGEWVLGQGQTVVFPLGAAGDRIGLYTEVPTTMKVLAGSGQSIYWADIIAAEGGVEEVEISRRCFVEWTYSAPLAGWVATATSNEVSAPQVADKLKTDAGVVVISGVAPLANQVLVATSPTAAAWVTPSNPGVGDVTGPASATDGHVAVYDGASGKQIKDGTKVEAELVTGPASATDGRVAVYSGASGKELKNGTKLEADLVTGPASAATAVVPYFNNVNGKVLAASAVQHGLIVTSTSGGTNGNLARFQSARTISDSGVPFSLVQFRSVQTPSANFTAEANTVYVVSTSTGSVTVTLPLVSQSLNKSIVIKRVGANPVVIDGNGAETIDGQATLTLNTEYESAELIAFGGAWYRI